MSDTLSEPIGHVAGDVVLSSSVISTAKLKRATVPVTSPSSADKNRMLTCQLRKSRR
jgi:hypothetical protein